MLLSCLYKTGWESLSFLRNEMEMWFQMSNFGFVINNSIVRSFTTIAFMQLALTGNSIYYLGAVWSYIYAANMHLYVPGPSTVSLFLRGRVHGVCREPDQIINHGEATPANWICFLWSSHVMKIWGALGPAQRKTHHNVFPSMASLCSGIRTIVCSGSFSTSIPFVLRTREASAGAATKGIATNFWLSAGDMSSICLKLGTFKLTQLKYSVRGKLQAFPNQEKSLKICYDRQKYWN